MKKADASACHNWHNRCLEKYKKLYIYVKLYLNFAIDLKSLILGESSACHNWPNRYRSEIKKTHKATFFTQFVNTLYLVEIALLRYMQGKEKLSNKSQKIKELVMHRFLYFRHMEGWEIGDLIEDCSISHLRFLLPRMPPCIYSVEQEFPLKKTWDENSLV